MAVKQFSAGEQLTASDTNTYLANSGLVVVTPSGATNGTVSGSKVTIGNAVSYVTVSGAFSATYDAYRIVVTGGASSVTSVIGLTFGSAATNYYYSFLYSSFTTTPLADGAGPTARFTYAGQMHATGGLAAQIEVVNPYLAKYTYISNPLFAGNGTYSGNQTGTLADTNSYTSFTLTTNTGTMTGGTIMVYGYRLG